MVFLVNYMGDKITITTDQAKTTHQFRIKCSILRDVKERTSYTGAPARALIVFYYNICQYFIHEKCIQNWNKIYVHFMFYETYGKQYLFLVNNSRSFHKLFIFRVQELHTSSLTIVMNFFSQTKHCFFWKIVRSVHFLVRTERWLLRSPIGIKVCLLFRGFRVFSLLFGFDTSEIVDLRDYMTPGSRPATSKFIMDWLRFLFGAANLLVVWCSCPKNSFNMLRRFDWCRHIGQRSTL